jgi:predicted SAM-dependent methyltransferase
MNDGLKLHVGCGKRYLPGFVHVDLADYPHIDWRRDVHDLSFLPPASADLLYASHVLEYFDRWEVKDVLRNWREVLRVGGTLRVAVPDFEAMSEVYQKGKKLDHILGPLYGRMEVGNTDQMIYHKTTYDFVSLAKVLEECGFVDVRQYDWRETIHSEVDDHSQAYLPHMDKEHGKLISLNVEATKKSG